jgi:drug/metabolite transporter (DMT)-like permease
VIALISAVFVWGGSTVGLKRLDAKVDPLCQTTGSLLFAAPGLLLFWYLFDGSLPQSIETESLLAVLFLAVIGSVVGFSLYYFVLSQISAVSASLITLMVPVLALILGVSIGGEDLSVRLLVGVFIVLCSLFFYLDIGYRLLAVRLKQKMQKVFAFGLDSGPRPGTD